MSESPEVAREHGTSTREAHRLADEADRLAGEGKEKKPKAGAIGFIDLRPVFGPS